VKYRNRIVYCFDWSCILCVEYSEHFDVISGCVLLDLVALYIEDKAAEIIVKGFVGEGCDVRYLNVCVVQFDSLYSALAVVTCKLVAVSEELSVELLVSCFADADLVGDDHIAER